MGKRVAVLILVLLAIGGAILWIRSTKTPVLPGPTPVATRPPVPVPTATKAPGPIAVCTPPPCTVAPNGVISVNDQMVGLPDTCVYNTTTPTMLTWRATDGSRLQKKIPNWGTQAPTTPINPYPSADCPSNPGTFCVSGSFGGQDIDSCTVIPYSISTTTPGGKPKEHFGHIVIIKP